MQQTGSSGTLIAGNLVKPLCPSMGPNGGSVAMDSEEGTQVILSSLFGLGRAFAQTLIRTLLVLGPLRRASRSHRFYHFSPPTPTESGIRLAKKGEVR
jgi:hypothetical protein